MTDSKTDKPRKLSRLAQDALDIVQQAQRRGGADLTLAEILHALRTTRPGSAIEKSSLSRELTHLALDGLLLRRSVKRKSAWEALPVGMDQLASPSSFAYYTPGAGSVALASESSGRASAADFY